MNDAPSMTRYPDSATLSGILAERTAAELKAAITARGAASLVVSGGRSPTPFFEHLRTCALDWSRVCITLADERWVSPSDPASNEGLVRNVLLKDRAAAAQFAALKTDAANPELGAQEAWRTVAGMARPFDVIMLGMGDDGHTASLFPESPQLPMALDPNAPPGCIGMLAPTEPRARLSLNLAALLDSRHIVILITGESKWLTYSKAMEPGAALHMPVRSILRQHHVPVDVVWCP